MKPRQLAWKWLLFGLLATIIAGAIFYHMLPDSTRVANRVAAELSAWTGGKAAFSGPVQVRYFPDVSIRGKFELSGGTRLPFVKSIVAREAKVSLSLIDLLRGRVSIDALRLVRPRIVLTQTDKKLAMQAQESRNLADALFAHGSVRVIHVRDGTLVFRSDSGLEVVKDIDAHLDGSDGQGSVSSFGSFVLRDETVRFALDSSALTKDAETSTLPLTLTLTSAPLNVKIAGKAMFGKTATLSGDMQAEIDNVRRFAVWSGINVPNGSNLNGFGLGRLPLPAHADVRRWQFHLDNSLPDCSQSATPRIEAQWLSTAVLDLSGGDRGRSADRPTVRPGVASAFDADFAPGAIDADEARAWRFHDHGKRRCDRSEVSEFELCGGTASGRLNADDSSDQRLSLAASVADVAIDSAFSSG
jgi:hypothetical protein